jgi:hypothetical protein
MAVLPKPPFYEPVSAKLAYFSGQNSQAVYIFTQSLGIGIDWIENELVAGELIRHKLTSTLLSQKSMQ